MFLPFWNHKNNLKVFDGNLPLTNLPYNKKFTRGSDRVRNFDYVLLSPGVNYRKCLLSNEIIKNKEKIISDLDVFYKSFPENFFITITGTNGKSTTAKILHDVLLDQKKDVRLIGNIGNPPLNEKKISKNKISYFHSKCSKNTFAMSLGTHLSILINISGIESVLLTQNHVSTFLK